MIASPPRPADFDLGSDICVDAANEGFTKAEMAAVTPVVVPAGAKGSRGILRELWPRNREAPPALRNLKSQFGYQTRPLLTNLVDIAAAQGTTLDGSIRARLPSYDFFLLQCGVYMLPDGGEQFEALKFEVRYEDEDVSTYSMLPGPQTETNLKVGGKIDVGVTGSMGFGIPEISIKSASVSADVKAKLESNFIYSFAYELKTRKVDAYGTGNSFCRWLMYEGSTLRNDVLFYPIVIAPKSTTGFDCEFKAYFKIGHSDWQDSEFFLKPSRTIHVSA